MDWLSVVRELAQSVWLLILTFIVLFRGGKR